MIRLLVGAAIVLGCNGAIHAQPAAPVMAGSRSPVSAPPAPPTAGAGVAESDPMTSTVVLIVAANQPWLTALDLALPINRAIESGTRMQRLKSLTFDRRPTAILSAWNPKSKDQSPDPDKPKAPPKKPEVEKLDREMESFQRLVSLGDWPAVRSYLQSLTEIEAKAAYDKLLQTLGTVPIDPVMAARMAAGLPVPPQVQEKNVFRTDDLIGLTSCAPRGLSRDHVRLLGAILRQAIDNGVVIENVVERFRAAVAMPGRTRVLSERQAARILAGAGQLVAVGRFLPEPSKALKEKDLEALNLLSRHYLELHAKDKRSPYLEKAWEATLSILALDGPRSEKDEAIRRAVDLAPRIREELGAAWLDQSYTKHPDRGMDILATLGSSVARSLLSHAQQTDERLKGLLLQKTAVDALLKAAPARADEWSKTLSLLASNWLKEAEYSRQYDHSTGYGNHMRRDLYGNFYFYNPDAEMERQQQMFMMQQGMPQAIATPEMLRCAPGGEWLKRVDGGVRPKIAIVLAELYLKVADENKAFPQIETLAPTHPDQAKELIKEFLRVWTKNHDPNANKNMYRNAYIYFYGFEQRAEGIPLTRSKQERNLVELSRWVERIRNLKLGDVDEEMLARAFTACHSSAEVYKTEAIETVFGKLGKLKPKTLASLAQTMRGNLAGIWRLPAEQEKKKTKRKQKDIEVEVRRGYEVALKTVANGLAQFPNDWALMCAKAALLHDRTTYEQEIAKSSDFSAQRRQALELFQKAAERYRQLVATRALSEDDESTQVYDQWFYASLGAVDLSQITEDRLPDARQPSLIRKAMRSLPAEAAKRHMDKFANNLFTRMSSAKPQIKFRYLKGGFEIVDADHKLAVEARKVYDYYKDLVSEIKLDVEVDGSTSVGHGQAFGVFVNIRHTRDIERESGGFSRYLQNQNSLMFSYNYGRPTADYRDRFENAAKEALKEHFDVVSVTFEAESVHSRAHRDYGWRVTPYAYILLKPRGPEVDKIPPLRLDLDFLDTSGFVVLPVESPAVPIDCKSGRPESRPVKKLQITQTLDERQAEQGKLLLEIKAVGIGLVGPLDELLKLDSPGFDIVKTDDNGVNVSKFDDVGDAIAVVSERNWTIQLQAREGQTELSKRFRFPTANVPLDEMLLQRYQDADVQKVSGEVDLEHRYGKRALGWLPWAIGGAAGLFLLAIAAAVLLVLRNRRTEVGPAIPGNLTPFAVLDFLTRLRSSRKWSDADRGELEQCIATLEAHFFAAEGNGQPPNLMQITRRWLLAAE